ncbi:MAG: hypothetical protein Q9159_006128 [Coniocarpon cinnabarinum]
MDALQSTAAENLKGGNITAKPEHKFTLEQVPPQDVAVVTGGSEGIGYGCTHTLLSRNISKLFILSVSEEVVSKAIDAVREELGQEAASKTVWYHCDLSDWKEVREVAETIKKQTDRLDILINNAARGIMTAQRNQHDVDLHMAINHMGHVTLTSHLLPLLKSTAAKGNIVRIGNTASNLHQSAPPDTKFASVEELNKDYGPNTQYGRAKLANILYARYLNKHLTSAHPNILANAVHPGVVATKMSSEDIHEPYPLAGYGLSTALQPFKKNQFEGCLSMMFVSTFTRRSGEYICPPATPEQGSDLSRDMELAEQLMKLTKEVVMEKTKPDSVDQGCPFQMY